MLNNKTNKEMETVAQKLLNMMADQVEFEGYACPVIRESKKGHELMTNSEVYGGREGYIEFASKVFADQLPKVTEKYLTLGTAIKLNNHLKDLKIEEYKN